MSGAWSSRRAAGESPPLLHLRKYERCQYWRASRDETRPVSNRALAACGANCRHHASALHPPGLRGYARSATRGRGTGYGTGAGVSVLMQDCNLHSDLPHSVIMRGAATVSPASDKRSEVSAGFQPPTRQERGIFAALKHEKPPKRNRVRGHRSFCGPMRGTHNLR
jgi:hypothetical protein